MLFIVRGLPGSGKTTWALSTFNPHVCVAADDYHTDQDGNYNFDRTKAKDAHDWCYFQMIEKLNLYGVAVVHNTFIDFEQIKRYTDHAERAGHGICIVDCDGNFGSVHSVPEATLQRMRDGWEETESFLYKIGKPISRIMVGE